MPRERWFYAKDMRRIGPLPKRQLVESLLALPDPRGCLIWRHGLPAWTPAREVPEIDRQLAPFAKVEPAAPAPAAVAGPLPETGIGAPAARAPKRTEQPSIAPYFGALAVLLGLVLVGWLVWPRSKEEKAAAAARGGPSRPQTGTAAASPRTSGAEGNGSAPGVAAPAFAGWSDEEEDLSPAELRRLRGVGAWSADKLTVTVYNGSTWRITEILVRTSRLRGEEFVDGETPQRLLPVAAAPVDAGTAELLKKVAPDRRKPGVNPLDTGPFEGTVGPQPEAYRWRIEGARGYPPLR